jgi:hypothetical protein
VAIVDLCVVSLVSCGLVAAVLLFVSCRQFLGIVEAGTSFLYLKKLTSNVHVRVARVSHIFIKQLTEL